MLGGFLSERTHPPQILWGFCALSGKQKLHSRTLAAQEQQPAKSSSELTGRPFLRILQRGARRRRPACSLVAFVPRCGNNGFRQWIRRAAAPSDGGRHPLSPWTSEPLSFRSCKQLTLEIQTRGNWWGRRVVGRAAKRGGLASSGRVPTIYPSAACQKQDQTGLRSDHKAPSLTSHVQGPPEAETMQVCDTLTMYPHSCQLYSVPTWFSLMLPRIWLPMQKSEGVNVGHLCSGGSGSPLKSKFMALYWRRLISSMHDRNYLLTWIAIIEPGWCARHKHADPVGGTNTNRVVKLSVMYVGGGSWGEDVWRASDRERERRSNKTEDYFKKIEFGAPAYLGPLLYP